MINLSGALVWSVAKFLDMGFWIYIIAIFMQAILSWFMPQQVSNGAQHGVGDRVT